MTCLSLREKKKTDRCNEVFVGHSLFIRLNGGRIKLREKLTGSNDQIQMKCLRVLPSNFKYSIFSFSQVIHGHIG